MGREKTSEYIRRVGKVVHKDRIKVRPDKGDDSWVHTYFLILLPYIIALNYYNQGFQLVPLRP